MSGREKVTNNPPSICPAGGWARRARSEGGKLSWGKGEGKGFNVCLFISHYPNVF